MEYKRQSTYPRFPEYVLLDLLEGQPTQFKRGALSEFIWHPEFERWQAYFQSEYAPPISKDVLLFHACSWGKPYDCSYTIRPIKELADRYPYVHRVILSSAGVIPYEYQMNPAFCSYDWVAVDGLTREQEAVIRSDYHRAREERVRKYLGRHRAHYRAVVCYMRPVRGGIIEQLGPICRELGLRLAFAPSVATYRTVRDRPYSDQGELFIQEECLGDLEVVLKDCAPVENG